MTKEEKMENLKRLREIIGRGLPPTKTTEVAGERFDDPWCGIGHWIGESKTIPNPEKIEALAIIDELEGKGE